jgi:hypothetical protein
VNGGDDPVADVHDETAAAQEANCPKPEPEPKPNLAQRVMELREAHDLAAARLCEALDDLQDSILGDALNLAGSQRAYQSGRTDGHSEMARECINAIDERLQALRPGTLAHQALSAHRRDMMRHVLPL